MNVTLIIPTLNEETNIKLIHRNSKYFSTGKIIIVDGGSEDNTKNCIKRLDLKLVEMSASRGKQLKKGAQKSNSTWLFFMHADSLINKENISEIKKFITLKKNKNRVAFFRLKFNNKGLWSKIISSICLWHASTQNRTQRNPRRCLRRPLGKSGSRCCFGRCDGMRCPSNASCHCRPYW